VRGGGDPHRRSASARRSIATRRGHDARAAGKGIVAAFMQEALPKASEATRELAGELIKTTLSEVGKHFSEDRAARRRSQPCRLARRHVLRLSRRALTTPRSFLTSTLCGPIRFGFGRIMGLASRHPHPAIERRAMHVLRPQFRIEEQHALEFARQRGFGVIVAAGRARPRASHVPFVLDRRDGQ
jgi:hypothetical protein